MTTKTQIAAELAALNVELTASQIKKTSKEDLQKMLDYAQPAKSDPSNPVEFEKAVQNLDAQTSDEALESLGKFGLGTNEDNAKCPHCGINHRQNGYGDEEDFEHEHACLGCGGEWGKHFGQNFKQMMNDARYFAPRNLCKALREVATAWTGSRKSFLEGAKDLGLNVANAAAEWQSARQK